MASERSAEWRQKWFVMPLRVHADERGSLVAVEAGIDVPFAIERVYYLYGAGARAERGFHAHHNLQQLAVSVSGSCTFLLDDGAYHEHVRLERPDVGLFIGSMVWREMRDFSADCVLLVLASRHYEEGDYIRDHGEFVRHVEAARGQ